MLEHTNIKVLQRQIIREMGAKNRTDAVEQLKEAIRSSEGRAQRTFEALLATLEAEADAAEWKSPGANRGPRVR